MSPLATAAAKVRQIFHELREHAPFTITGALLGVVFMVLFRRLIGANPHGLFLVFHPLHVLLSAMVTASLYKLHRPAAGFLTVLVIGYVGSIGIATLSDSVIPFLGENVLGLNIPRHSDLHEEHAQAQVEQGLAHEDEGHEADVHGHEQHAHGHEEGEGRGLHLGFIEDWYVVNPGALVGILIAFRLPHTKAPHASHVLVSTWASLAHIMMNQAQALTLAAAFGVAAVLFLAVWLPCCLSDIVFPTLFVAANGHKHEGHHHGK